MKLSLLSSLLIILGTIVVAVLQSGRIDSLDKEQAVLEGEARALGIPLTTGRSAKSPDRSAPAGSYRASAATRAAELEAEEEGKAFAQELIAFWRKMEAMQKTGKEPTLEQQREIFDFLNRFLSLEAAAIPHLMAEIRDFDEMDANIKREILGMALTTMAQSAPEKAMELYINSGDLFEDDRRTAHIIARTLGAWSAQDPRAALDWLDLNSASLDAGTVAEARKTAIAQAFAADPQFAAAAALKLEKEQILAVSQQLGPTLRTPEHHLDLLSSLQDSLAPLEGDLPTLDESALADASPQQVLRGGLLLGFGSSLATESFESARTLLESADLSTTDRSLLAAGLVRNARQMTDPGAWLPWLHEHGSQVSGQDPVSSVVKSWTQNDFRSAADWIGSQEPGPLRESATRSFAETVAPHEPASAAEWALTLPPSEDRTELLQNIQNIWAKKDTEAAAAFAARHGLQNTP